MKIDSLVKALDQFLDGHDDCLANGNIIHTVGFFDEGPGFGVGVSTRTCESCETYVGGLFDKYSDGFTKR